MKTECDNCGKKVTDSGLISIWEAHGFFERVEAGQRIPAGECRACGSWAYPIQDKYTVVGMYPDNKQVYITSLRALSGADAAARAKAKVKKEQKEFGLEIAVLCVFLGEVKGVGDVGDEMYEE